jgi:fructose-1,6-bisphosphatase/inositol monophosphatase family enzyme
MTGRAAIASPGSHRFVSPKPRKSESRTAMIDLDTVSTLVREVAEAEILPRFGRLRDEDIRQKSGPMDLVTRADTEAEKALTTRLLELFPGTVVLGEEAATANPELLRLVAGERPVWVLDPVDGTLNFVNNRPAFAVIVAYLESGRPTAGWIHHPLTGTTIMGARGRGAWCGSIRLQIASDIPLSEMIGSAYGRAAGAGYVSDALQETGVTGGVHDLFSSSVEYMEILQRRRHFFFTAASLPWDHAAGVLLVQEAGGIAAFIDGSEYDPQILDGRLLSAPNTSAWRGLQAALNPIIREA